VLSHLKNNKSHGSDGIPGEAYKQLKKWLGKPLLQIMHKIQNGDQMPPEWKHGTIVHIYKNKGEVTDTKNYRPICLTQLIYKIWSALQTQRLSKILHLVTSTTQYGYKQSLSTIDAIYKLEQYIQESNTASKILLLDLSKAFDTINRTQLWATLYKKGLPLETIAQIRQGHKNTKLCPKHQGRYGDLQTNNVGVFRGSAISALLFIIYLDDMMQDLQALNHKNELPMRIRTQRQPETDITRNTDTINTIKQNTKKNKKTKTPIRKKKTPLIMITNNNRNPAKRTPQKKTSIHTFRNKEKYTI